jgi:hypothetical protein
MNEAKPFLIPKREVWEAFKRVKANQGPRARGTGSIGCAVRIQHSLLIGHYATATAEHREPYESRGSRTVLRAPEGESPSGDSSIASLG